MSFGCGIMLNNFYDAALALMYPLLCAVCGLRGVERREDSPVCDPCWSAAKIFTCANALCWKCGAPTLQQSGGHHSFRPQDVRCRRCEHEAFTAARAVGIYEGALRAAVLALKKQPHVSERLLRLLCEVQQRGPLAGATCIIPVPLHANRQEERGFNQAEVIARGLAALVKLPLDEASVKRITHSEKHRAGMDVVGRRQTVRNAFRVDRPRLIKGQSPLLIDDVFTTGATVSACAEALKLAGAIDVFILTIARA